jgi:primase-polymerase (primpol)-like protein
MTNATLQLPPAKANGVDDAPRPPKPPRSIATATQLARVPLDLTELARWVVWRFTWKNKGWTKPPFQSLSPDDPASTTDPKTWSSYGDALQSYLDTPDLAGIGFVFHPPDGFVGIDFDNSLDATARLKPWAAEIFRRLNCGAGYVEISPSGNGIKAWMRGAMPSHHGKTHAGRSKEWIDPVCGRAKIELYSSGRFFTTTGLIFADGGQP